MILIVLGIIAAVVFVVLAVLMPASLFASVDPEVAIARARAHPPALGLVFDLPALADGHRGGRRSSGRYWYSAWP